MRTVYSFVETRLFSRLVGDYLTDDQYAALQATLVHAPDRGAKNEEQSIPAHVLRRIKEEMDG